jgi:hypothetical protein
VTLVIRPGRGGTMRAGFFVREADGTVRGERSYLEFNFPDRLAGILDRPPDRPVRERPERRAPSFYRAEATAAAPAPAPRESSMLSPPFDTGPQLLPPQPAKRKWPWLVVWALLLIAAAVFGLRLWMPSAPERISLAVVERDGELQVEWNHAAKPVASAVKGSLQIVDGSDSRTIALTPQALASGKFTYQRKTGDIEVRMTVEGADGVKAQEASRFLGRPPTPAASVAPPPADLAALEKRRQAAEAEVQRLRRENAAQAARIQQLQRTLRLLETRLNIDKQ